MNLWITYESSGRLKYWYSGKSSEYLPVGEALVSDLFTCPLIFAVSGEQSILTFEPVNLFSFILRRDDSESLPVYELGTPSGKIMIIFSEFACSVGELCRALGLEFLSLDLGKEAGAFELHVRLGSYENPGELARAITLLRAGLEILAWTRGFQLDAISNAT